MKCASNVHGALRHRAHAAVTATAMTMTVPTAMHAVRAKLDQRGELVSLRFIERFVHLGHASANGGLELIKCRLL